MPIGKTRGESRTIAFMEKRAHILVVDDEQAIADLVVNLLVAEGMDALLARYGCVRDGGLYRCERNTDDRIVLFCHFAVSMAILAHMLNLSPVALWHGVSLQPTSLTTLITEERRPGEVFFRMMEMGDTSHLYAGGEPVSHQGLYRERFEQPGDAPAK